MSFSINSIIPNILFCDGGHKITVYGNFEENGNYNIFIGDHKNTTDSICYSGIPGQRNLIYPELNNSLIGYTPLLNITGVVYPYSVTVVNSDSLEAHVLIDCLYIYNRQFYTKVYEIRKNLLPCYLTGPINIDNEDQ
jgi:hypothetical protein